MSHRTVRIGLPILLFVVLIAGMLGITRYYARLPENLSQHETILLGRSRFVPGSPSALRILVRDAGMLRLSREPISRSA